MAVLVKRLGVSEVTVRRYLEELEQDEVLLRTYGGAVRSHSPVAPDFFFGEKAKKNRTAKQAIARAAAGLIKENESIFLDTGTTTLEISRILAGAGAPMTVVTNSLPIAAELAGSPAVKIFLIGGLLRKELLDFAGPSSENEVARLSFHQAFLGVDGVSGTAGLTTTDEATARYEEAVIRRSRTINVVADSSKIGRISLIPYGEILKSPKPRRLITDANASREEVAKLRAAGIEVRLVKP